MNKIVAFLKANPALAGGVISVGLTLGAAFGLHLSADQLALVAAIVAGLTHGAVHVAVTPVKTGEHEKT